MNDFQYTYIHQARSREMIAEAQRERQVRELRNGSEPKHRVRDIVAGFRASRRNGGRTSGAVAVCRDAHPAKLRPEKS